MTIEPVVDHDAFEVELVALRWGKMRLSPPRWLRLTRRFPVAPLPLGMSIVEARRRGRGAEFRLAVASVRRNIDAALSDSARTRQLAEHHESPEAGGHACCARGLGSSRGLRGRATLGRTYAYR